MFQHFFSHNDKEECLISSICFYTFGIIELKINTFHWYLFIYVSTVLTGFLVALEMPQFIKHIDN